MNHLSVRDEYPLSQRGGVYVVIQLKLRHHPSASSVVYPGA